MNNKGQLNLVFFIISFLILVLILVLLPVINIFINNTLTDPSLSTVQNVDNNQINNVSSIEYYGIVLYPMLMVLAGVVGFFMWSSGAK